MARYCPICNTSSSEAEFVGELCTSCAIKEEEKKVTVPAMLQIYVCRQCGRIKAGGVYQKYNKDTLAEAIEGAFGIKTWKVRSVNLEGSFATVRLRFEIGEEHAFTEKRFRIKINKQMCNQCSKMAGGYYEAHVQLRGDYDRVQNMAKKIAGFVEKNGAFISKDEEVANGRDLYISSKALVNEFMRRNELKPIRSFQLYGVRSGKKIYRNIYSLRF